MANHRLRDWVSYVQEHPEDIQARYQFIEQMPELIEKMNMRDHMVAYRLSRMFAPGSERQTNLLEQSAKMGNTNAMLEIAQQSLTGDNPQLQRAVKFLQKIFASGDSFIKDEAKQLLEVFPKISRMLEAQLVRVSRLGMFQQPSSELEEQTHPRPSQSM